MGGPRPNLVRSSATTDAVMMNIPEETAREYAPYLVIVEIQQEPQGWRFSIAYPLTDLRGIEATLRTIRMGAMTGPDCTIRRVFLAYNAIELPIPLTGIKGVRQ